LQHPLQGAPTPLAKHPLDRFKKMEWKINNQLPKTRNGLAQNFSHNHNLNHIQFLYAHSNCSICICSLNLLLIHTNLLWIPVYWKMLKIGSRNCCSNHWKGYRYFHQERHLIFWIKIDIISHTHLELSTLVELSRNYSFQRYSLLIHASHTSQ